MTRVSQELLRVGRRRGELCSLVPTASAVATAAADDASVAAASRAIIEWSHCLRLFLSSLLARVHRRGAEKRGAVGGKGAREEGPRRGCRPVDFHDDDAYTQRPLERRACALISFSPCRNPHSHLVQAEGAVAGCAPAATLIGGCPKQCLRTRPRSRVFLIRTHFTPVRALFLNGR